MTDSAPPTPAALAYPRELVRRPIQVPKGRVEAGAEMQVFTGLDAENWDPVFGNWIGFAPTARYGVTDTIEVGAQAFLLPIKPSGDFEDSKLFGGLLAGGGYRLHELASARVELGLGLRGRLMWNPYLRPLQEEPLFGDLTFGFRVGFSVKKSFQGRVAISAEPRFAVQLDGTKDHDAGCEASDHGCVKPAMALHLPIAAHYQATPIIAVGLRTGLYTGSEVQFDAQDGATIPLIAEGLVTLAGGAIDAGLRVGYYSLVGPDDGPDIGETLYLGLFAGWRNR